MRAWVHLDAQRSRPESRRGWAACGQLTVFRTLSRQDVSCPACRELLAGVPVTSPAPRSSWPGTPCGEAKGTEAGYQRHVKGRVAGRRTVPCEACSRAHSQSTQRSHARGRCAQGLGWPLERDYWEG